MKKSKRIPFTNEETIKDNRIWHVRAGGKRHPFCRSLMGSLCFMLVLGGCSAEDSESGADIAQNTGSQTEQDLADASVFMAKLIDGAGTDTWILDGEELFSMPAQNLQVSNGMTLQITGTLKYGPGFLPIVEDIQDVEITDVPKDNRYEIGWTILEQLWESDSALQDDIECISIDLSQADFLDENEKSWLRHSFMSTYGAGKTLTSESAEELQEDETWFETGIYLGITSKEDGESLQLEGTKLRSALGADTMIFTASYAGETWNLQLEEQTIS